MSFKRLEPEDFLISTDAIVAPAFSNNSSTLNPGGGGNSGVSADYFDVTIGGDGRVECSKAGYNIGDAEGEPTLVVAKALDNILEGGNGLPIGSGSAFAIERSRFKQSIFPPTFKFAGEAPLTGSTDVVYTEGGRRYVGESGNYYLYPDVGLFLTTAESGEITCDSEEVITSNYIFIRARNAEFNYSTNPSFIDNTTGGVIHSDFITAPQTFITGVGLYNDNGDLLAVAKLSKPLKKDFTKEALIRVKLDF